MKYSLIQVYKQINNLIDGVWVQDFTGDFEDAVSAARKTEQVNSNRIVVAVVEKVNSSSPNYNLLTNLIRLD